ncbi:hypothetical protein B0H10DRAFT_2194412 [Mycena sp. CBHHK59/15]|nr:hypothetical protein B0H10DRAFT_2194412 [Mycena sp. CBHHK59/15]
MTMPQRPPGCPLLIPPLPLETSDCAGPTAVSLNPHQPPVEPLLRNSEKLYENMQNTIDVKQRGRNERLRAIQEAINPRAKCPGGTQAGLEPPRKRTRKAVNISGTETAQAQEMIMKLSPEQAQFSRWSGGGANVFFTGSAGNESLLLRQIIKSLKMKYPARPHEISDAVAITASTGITLNSFAGIGQGEGSAEHFISNIKRNARAATQWNRTKVLTVGEISMVDGGLFDKLSQIGSTQSVGTRRFPILSISPKFSDSETKVISSETVCVLLISKLEFINMLNDASTLCQVYVALSRATLLDRLEVLNFKPEHIRPDARAMQWTKSLETL